MTRAADIAGRVVSDDGGPLANAWVHASQRSTITDERGRFRLGPLPAGPCTLRVALVGYRPTQTIASIDSSVASLEIRLTSLAIPIGEISVQSSRSSGGAATLSQEQLSRISGTGDDVMRAVQTLPGVAAPELSSSFLLRGGESDETLVRYDGIDLLEAYHVREWGGSFSVVSMDETDRIRLIRGGLSSRYGRHLSGVLEIDGPDRRPERATVDLGLGFSQARVAADMPMGRGSLFVAAHEGLFAPVARTVQFDPDANVIPEFHDLMIRAQRPVSEHGTLTALALGVLDDVRYDENFPGNDIHSNVRDAVVGLRWQGRPPSGASHEGAIAFDYFDRLERLGLTGASDGRTRAARGRWTSRIPVAAAMTVETGLLAEYEASFLRFDSIEGSIRNGVYRESISSRLRGPAIRRRAEFWWSWESQWGAGLSTSLGVNAAMDRYGWGVRRDGSPVSASSGDTHLSPRLAIAAQVTPTVTVRASAGILRQPTFLNNLDEARALATLGRERFAREVAAGIDFVAKGSLIRLEGYLRRDRGVGFPIQDLTGRPDDLDLDWGDARGLELLARSPSWRRVDATLSYAWSRATWETMEGDVSRSFDQPHALTAFVNVRPAGRWNLNGTLRYHTGNAYTETIWSSSGGGFFWEQSYGPLMAERFPYYMRVDLRLSHPVSWGRGSWFYIEVLNVANRTNPYARSYRFDRLPGGGSYPSYFFVDLIPLLPFAGIEVRF